MLLKHIGGVDMLHPGVGPSLTEMSKDYSNEGCCMQGVLL